MPFGVVPRAGAVGLAFAGCFLKPDAPQGSGVAEDGSITPGDGLSTIDTATPCLVRDDFDSGTGCGTWGQAEGSGSYILTRSGGQLLIYATTSGGRVACQGTVDVPFTSVIVQIPSVVEAIDARTGVSLQFDDAKTFTLDITKGDTSSRVTATHDGAPTDLGNYSGSTMQFFRFRKQGAGQIELSYSSDGATWPTTLLVPTTSTLGMVRVRLYVEFGTNVSEFVSAEFDNLDGCAP